MTSQHHGPTSSRTGLIDQAGTKRRTSDEIPRFLGQYIPTFQENQRTSNDWSRTRPSGSLLLHHVQRLSRVWKSGAWRPRDLLDIRLGLIIIWTLLLWWGEEAVFERSVQSCDWGKWESWPSETNPHHVVLVADPQLVDPHTYPGRPWPISTLTIKYTDRYIRKSFQKIQKTLQPDSVFFLGDLFDGGREWSTPPGRSQETESPDKRWRKYGQTHWIKEYGRFNRIFFDSWLTGRSTARADQRGRRIIAGLPGNHDLGLGNGIRMPVRQRFNAYFGDGNRIDVIGNHTFVSLDTVSLSAKGQPDPATGTEGLGHGEGHSKHIWGPVDEFLHTVGAEKVRTIHRELRVQNGEAENEIQESVAVEFDDARAYTIDVAKSEHGTDIPSVVLTHVPLYRAEGTPCGPLREKYPPSGPGVEKDEANAIHVQAGVQYQNVLTPSVSDEIVELVGDVTNVFSGDDHDYCDVVHRRYTSKNGGIREITVKSISWAMGVRKPGFALLSLWNPVDADGKAIDKDAAKKATIQSHLCILPDQLSTFIWYGWLLMFTIMILVTRAFLLAYRRESAASRGDVPLLPLSTLEASSHAKKENLAPIIRGNSPRPYSSSSSSSDNQNPNGLAVRSSNGRPRSMGPSNDYGYDYEMPGNFGRRRGNRSIGRLASELRQSIVQVACVVLLWYTLLLWNS